MDRKKLVAIVALVVVIVVAVVITRKRTSNEATPVVPVESAKIDMIDTKTLEIFSEPPADWKGKYAPDASGHHKNPKTGEYTVVATMKCASCGQLIPVPDIPADLLPPAPPPGQKGRDARGPALAYMAAQGKARMQVLREYKCPRCGKSAWIKEASAPESQ